LDIVVAGDEVHELRRGGGAPIPMLGFTLRIPPGQLADLAQLRRGDPVSVLTTFPARLGRVHDAMACGPVLVRDGEVDLDLDLEGFGEKDSHVLPFSLSRAIDTFRAARSFVMLTASTLVLGAVSGTQLGRGPATVSAGITLGDLAALCRSLGAEHAITMDGGGSSSLVAMANGRVRQLNIPTGGADVPEGQERYLNTYWLAECVE
jgi:hypothetical protein